MQDIKQRPDLAASPALSRTTPSGSAPRAKGLSNPLDAAQYGAAWLSLQCNRIKSIRAAVLRVHTAAGEPITVRWPSQDAPDEDWLGRLAERAGAERRTVVLDTRVSSGKIPAPPDGNAKLAVATPLGIADPAIAAVAVALAPRQHDPHELGRAAIAEERKWGAGWLETVRWGQRLSGSQADLGKAMTCLDIIAACTEEATPTGTLITICNEFATRFGCNRVSFGRARGNGSVKLFAISHSAGFAEHASMVSAIECAMEEACERGATVCHPQKDTRPQVCSAHTALAANRPGSSVLSLIIAGPEGNIAGVMTLERSGGPEFAAPEVQTAEAAAALLGPLVAAQLRANRLISGRLVTGIEAGLATLLSNRRVGLKLAAISTLVAVVLLGAMPMEHRIRARAVLEPQVQRAASVPFDGYIASAPIRAGDVVKTGQLLAALDDRDLLIERAKWTAERDKLMQRQREALAKTERSALVVLAPQIDQALSQLALIEEKLSRTRLMAPFDGLVVSGDLSQLLGTPVEKGKVLFEIAPLDSYRLSVQVDERDISYVHLGQRGSVELTGVPSARLPLELTRLTPVTVAADGGNTFRAEARLIKLDPRLRPGLEGIAKLDAGPRSILWIWTRPLIDWLRLSAWRYLP